MAVSISAMFKLVDQMSAGMERIGSKGNTAMSNIEKSSSKADQAFTKCQTSASTLSKIYQNFEGNAEQLANAVQRGEKTLASMNQTAASTFEYSTKLDTATEAQERLQSALSNADKAAQNYETVINDSSSTVEDFAAAEEELHNATVELYEAYDKGAEAALDLDEASDKAAEGVEKFGKESKEAAEKGEEFGDKTGNAIQSLEQLLVAAGITKLLSEIKDGLIECATASEAVETSAAKLETLAGSNNMGMLSDQLSAISVSAGEAQEDLYDVAYNAISAGTDVYKAAEITKSATELATAGFTSSSSALSVLTTATNSYGETAGTATDITDGLITVQNLGVTTVGELASSMGKSISTAAAYNVSLQNLESAYISVTKAGIKTQEGTTYINGMINELGKSTSEVAKILQEETGKSFGELMKAGYSLGDALSIIYEKAGRNGEAMMNMFGSQTAAIAAAAIVNQGLDNFNSNLDAVKNSAGATSKAFSIMAETTEFSHNKMKNSSENLKIAIGDQLNPILKKYYDSMSGVLDKVSAYIQQNPWVIKAVTTLTATLATFVGTIVAAKLAVAAFTAIMNTNPIFLAVTAIAALTAGFVALATSIEAAYEEERREQLTATSQRQKEKIEELNAEYEKFKGTSAETSEEANKLRYEIDDLSSSFEQNKMTIGELEDSIEQNAKEIKENAEEYEDAMNSIENQRLGVYGLIQKLEDLVKTNDNTAESESRIKSVIDELNKALPDLSLNFEDVTNNVDGYVEIMKKAAEAKFNADKKEATLNSLSEQYEKRAEAQRNYNMELENYTKAQEELMKAAGEPVGDHRIMMLENFDYVQNLPSDFETNSKVLEKVINARDNLNAVNEKIKDMEDELARVEEAARYAWENPIDAAEASKNILDKYKDSIEELCTKFGEAYTAAYESFQGQFGLFDEASTKSEEYLQSSVANAQTALDSQLEYWKTYNNNISQLRELSAEELGLTKEQYDAFMSYIQDGSEEAAGLAQSMVDNIKNGNEGAVEKLAQTYAAVDEQQQKAADTVADWQTDFYQKLEDIEKKMKDCVEEMKLDDEAQNAAKYTIQSYAQSLRDNMGVAVAAATDVATAVKNALNLSGKAANIVSSTSSSSGYASGTENASPGVHLVGENGPELMLFRGGEEVIPASETENIIARSMSKTQDSIPNTSMSAIPSMTYSSSDDKEKDKTINLNINGQGNISVKGSMSKDEILDIMLEYAKPVMMSIIEDEIIEEGEGSYDY